MDAGGIGDGGDKGDGASVGRLVDVGGSTVGARSCSAVGTAARATGEQAAAKAQIESNSK